MNLDDFKAPLRQQQYELDQTAELDINAIRSGHSMQPRETFVSRWVGSILAAVGFVACGYAFFHHPHWLGKIGLLLGMVTFAITVNILNWFRMRLKAECPTLAVDEYCRNALARVERQRWIRKSIAWWCFAPALLAGSITIAGSMPGWVPKLVVLFGTLLIVIPSVWLINRFFQRNIHDPLDPLRSELLQWIDETSGDSDVTAYQFSANQLETQQGNGQVTSVSPALLDSHPQRSFPIGWVLAASVCFVGMSMVFLVIGAGALYIASEQTPELSITSSLTESERLESIDRWLVDLNEAGRFNGGVLIARSGEPLLMKTYGVADVDATRPLTPETPFRLASVSKSFTAAGILRLVEKGIVDLDQPLESYLPGFPSDQVTIRHLLNQTSGIPDVYMDLAETHRSEVGEVLTLTDVVDLLRKHPPVFTTPGEHYEYGNTNYVLLAAVIESASNQSFENFMQQEIFVPLGMNDTRVWNLVSDQAEFPERAEDFMSVFGVHVALPMSWIDGVAGDGAVYCSLNDFLIWDDFWNGNSLISDDLLAQAFQRPRLNDGSSGQYGFGWVISNESRGEVWHNGSWLGARTYLWRDGETKDCVVVLDNSRNKRVEDIAETIASAMNIRPAKQSPFRAMRFVDEEIYVTYQSKEYLWESIDSIDVVDLVSSTKRQFGGRWKMRVSEDLVEVLWGMGHHPGDTVSLKFLDPKTGESVVIKDAVMSSENRDRIRRSRLSAENL